MRCDEEAAFCLGDHIAPKLNAKLRPGGGNQWKAYCPAHDDSTPSLDITVGDRRRIIWHCKAGCPETVVRTAMIRTGVPESCLPQVKGQRTEDELIAELLPLLKEKPGTLAHLRITALTLGYDTLPTGGIALRGLVSHTSVPLSSAYDAIARAAGRPRRHGGGSNPQPVITPDVTERPNTDFDGSQNRRSEASCNGTSSFQNLDTDSSFATRSVTFRYAAVPELPTSGISVTRRCGTCGRELPLNATARRRYCNDTCRQQSLRTRRDNP